VAVYRKTAQAEADLIDIWAYIAPDNMDAADRLLDTFEAKGLLLAENPQLGQARPDIEKEFRYLVLERKVRRSEVASGA